MELVACTNTLRHCETPDKAVVDTIQHRLENLAQNILIKPETASNLPPVTVNATKIRITADFYHLAALIYFRREVQHMPPRSTGIQSLVDSALKLIRRMEICTSPWPLFVVACEVRNDAQRLEILQTLRRMEVERRIGNIQVARIVVEALWKQQDLALHDVAGGQIDWRDLVNMEDGPPSFI
jgi:hypothetical protein